MLNKFLNKKMHKIVTYNGGTDSYYGHSSSPENLVVGKRYEVTLVTESRWHTELTLKGIDGQFDSTWFNEDYTAIYPPTFLATSCTIPIVGQRCELSKLEYTYKKYEFVIWSTSPVTAVTQIGLHIYKVQTLNSVYMVIVQKDNGDSAKEILWHKNKFQSTFLATSPIIPTVGSKYICSKLEYKCKSWELVEWYTSSVTAVTQIGLHIYKVQTLNSVYIVQVH